MSDKVKSIVLYAFTAVLAAAWIAMMFLAAFGKIPEVNAYLQAAAIALLAAITGVPLVATAAAKYKNSRK